MQALWDRKGNSDCQALRGGGNRELLFNGYSSLVWDEWVLEIVGGDGCTALWMYLVPLNCTPSNGWSSKFVIYILP